ncbi:MAG: DUF2236 domain-containing protein, partial [Rhodomicrobium sp.]|nr:DUF2236 domain-containing protein [Rhodomicrobium sp.]
MGLLPAGKSFSLQRTLVNRLDRASRELLLSGDGPAIDFSRPAGEPALAAPDSVSWRIFRNPVSLFIGGVAAVILELAEPRVRTGVWKHSGFRADPVRRLRRTGLAAMVTVYGPRSIAEEMIAGVRQMHDRVRGVTPSGQAYSANDPDLLNWVHATAAFGFLQAYHSYATPLSAAERDRYYREGAPAAALYGVTRIAGSEAEIHAVFEAMRGQLEPSPILFEFLGIMRNAPVLPAMLRPAQPLFVRAAVSLTPPWIRDVLGLTGAFCLRPWQEFLVKRAGALAGRIVLESSPAVQSCLRM